MQPTENLEFRPELARRACRPLSCRCTLRADGLLQLFRRALECSICFLMDLPGLRPVPPVRVLVVGWGACMAHVTDLTNLQLAISTAVAAAGGARWYCLTLSSFLLAVLQQGTGRRSARRCASGSKAGKFLAAI